MESEAPARGYAVALRERANWIQLVKFSVIGGFGYLVNLAVFTVLVSNLNSPVDVAAVVAFCVAVVNNFVWNRYWTFGPGEGPMAFQAARFLTVSIVSLVVNLIMLELLLKAGGVGEIPAQAIAVATAMPVSFLGNKLWTFT